MEQTENSKLSSKKNRERKRRKAKAPQPQDDFAGENAADETETDEPEAGPSSRTLDILSGDSTNMRNGTTRKSTGFTTGEDFISFDRDTDSERLHSVSTREWDKGKAPMTSKEGEHAGRKRRWEELNGDEDASTVRRKADAANRRAPWTENVDWEACRNVAELLHKEVEAFIEYISPSSIEHEVRSMTVQIISQSISKAIPDATVLPFGSFGTKLYLPSGDIDLVVLSDSLNYMDKDSILRTIANIVKRSGITDKVTIIGKAKVPIVKFITNHSRFSVDISINQMNGISAGKMINRFIDEVPALRALVLVIKSFLNQRSMNEVFSGGLGSYSIVCLATSFLQMHPKIRRGEIDASKNLGVLVLEFFELYGCYFNYTETGVSLRRGGMYFSKRARGWFDPRKAYLLSIEDPGDISNDISRGSFGIVNVKRTFAGAYEMLKSAAYIRAGILQSRRQGSFVSLQRENGSKNKLEDMSILSVILGVSQETINHRELVLEVYNSGVLQKALGMKPPKITPLISSNSVNGISKTSKRTKELKSVTDAWEEADMEFSSPPRARTPSDENDISGSRYDIDRGGSDNKRMRLGRSSRLVQAVFTTDDDFEASDDDSLDEEERDYAAAANLSNGKKGAHDDEAVARRRAFWAAKAAVGTIDNYEDSS